jgi:hypothetical protein
LTYEGAGTPAPVPEPSKSGMERRQFPRIEIATKVSYAVVIPAYELGTSKDISQGGLCLEMKRKVATGTILRLEFDLPGDKPEHIEALGRVMWQRSQVGETFPTGVKFLT